jgi:hypothetical protein
VAAVHAIHGAELRKTESDVVGRHGQKTGEGSLLKTVFEFIGTVVLGFDLMQLVAAWVRKKRRHGPSNKIGVVGADEVCSQETGGRSR